MTFERILNIGTKEKLKAFEDFKRQDVGWLWGRCSERICPLGGGNAAEVTSAAGNQREKKPALAKRLFVPVLRRWVHNKPGQTCQCCEVILYGRQDLLRDETAPRNPAGAEPLFFFSVSEVTFLFFTVVL